MKNEFVNFATLSNQILKIAIDTNTAVIGLVGAYVGNIHDRRSYKSFMKAYENIVAEGNKRIETLQKQAGVYEPPKELPRTEESDTKEKPENKDKSE